MPDAWGHTAPTSESKTSSSKLNLNLSVGLSQCGFYKEPVIVRNLFQNGHPSTLIDMLKVRKRAKIRNQYNQAPHLTQDTNGKVTTLQLDITNESQEVNPFPAGDHKTSINRRAQIQEMAQKRSAALEQSVKN